MTCIVSEVHARSSRTVTGQLALSDYDAQRLSRNTTLPSLIVRQHFGDFEQPGCSELKNGAAQSRSPVSRHEGTVSPLSP